MAQRPDRMGCAIAPYRHNLRLKSNCTPIENRDPTSCPDAASVPEPAMILTELFGEATSPVYLRDSARLSGHQSADALRQRQAKRIDPGNMSMQVAL
jgi:hypothetical protein